MTNILSALQLDTPLTILNLLVVIANETSLLLLPFYFYFYYVPDQTQASKYGSKS